MEQISSYHPQPKGPDQSIHQKPQHTGHPQHDQTRYRDSSRADHLVDTLEEIAHFYREKDHPVIFVFGNLASGKTTLCNKIKALLPAMDIQIISMDYFRKKAFIQHPGLPDYKKEKIAQKTMSETLASAIATKSMIIIEGTYITNIWRRAIKKHKLDLFMIKVSTDRDTCYQRYMERESRFNMAPALRIMATKKANTPFHKSYDHISFIYHQQKTIYQPHVNFIR